MRKIIFKGKRVDNGEWVCSGNLIHFNEDDQHFIANLNEKCISTHDENDHIVAIEDTKIYKVIPETVGQYTGLTDKNGKKIFTKDIVVITALGDDHHQKGVKTIAVVEDYMGNTCLCIGGKHQTGTTLYDVIIAHTVEVVGDTMDNPELLKGGD